MATVYLLKLKEMIFTGRSCKVQLLLFYLFVWGFLAFFVYRLHTALIQVKFGTGFEAMPN